MKVGNVQLPDGTWRSFWNERDLLLRRVVLGVSWPAERPGHIVVVGEGLTMRPPYLFHVLSEAAAWTAAKLIRRAQELAVEWHVGTYYARMDEAALTYVAHHNAEACQRNERPFLFEAAPHADAGLAFHLELLHDLLEPSRKRLHFSKESRLPAALREIGLGEVREATEAEHPLVAALGYAVGALVTYPPLGAGDEMKDRADSDYDIYFSGKTRRQGRP